MAELTSVQIAMRDATPSEDGPRLTISRDDRALRRWLMKLRYRSLMEYQKVTEYMAPELRSQLCEAYIPVIILGLLQKGDVNLWNLTRKWDDGAHREICTYSAHGFEEACQRLVEIEGITYIPKKTASSRQHP